MGKTRDSKPAAKLERRVAKIGRFVTRNEMFGSVKRPSLLGGELASVPGSNKSRLFLIEKKRF